MILIKPLSKSFFALLILCTVAKNEVPSASSFGLHFTPSEKLLIQIRNNRGLRIDLYGTSARILPQAECRPFKVTLCFRDFRKSVKIFKKDSLIPFYSNL